MKSVSSIVNQLISILTISLIFSTSLIAYAKSYPYVTVIQWLAVDDNGEGWGMDGNFYVVIDYDGADPKFGIGLGMRPPKDVKWVENGMYQMYIQFEANETASNLDDVQNTPTTENPTTPTTPITPTTPPPTTPTKTPTAPAGTGNPATGAGAGAGGSANNGANTQADGTVIPEKAMRYNNVVCSMEYRNQIINQRMWFQNSCGETKLSSLQGGHWSKIRGDVNCQDPWKAAPKLSGFRMAPQGNDVDDKRQYVACSFYRQFRVNSVTLIGHGLTINYRAGFNFFTSELSTNFEQSGSSDLLTWVVIDGASKLVLGSFGLLLASATLLNLV